MTDDLRKCENYMKAREHTVRGFHMIVPAEPGADAWRQRSCTVGGNRCQLAGRVGRGNPGYIGKHGFQEHT
jgi:hypothetical protein